MASANLEKQSIMTRIDLWPLEDGEFIGSFPKFHKVMTYWSDLDAKVKAVDV